MFGRDKFLPELIHLGLHINFGFSAQIPLTLDLPKHSHLFLMNGLFFELSPYEISFLNISGEFEPKPPFHDSFDKIPIITSSNIKSKRLFIFLDI